MIHFTKEDLQLIVKVYREHFNYPPVDGKEEDILSDVDLNEIYKKIAIEDISRLFNTIN